MNVQDSTCGGNKEINDEFGSFIGPDLDSSEEDNSNEDNNDMKVGTMMVMEMMTTP